MPLDMAKILFLSFCLIANIIKAQTYLGIEATSGISSILKGSPKSIKKDYSITEFDFWNLQNIWKASSKGNPISKKEFVAAYSFGVVFRYVSKYYFGVQTGFSYRNYGVKLYDTHIYNPVENVITYRFIINNFEMPLLLVFTTPKIKERKITPMFSIGAYSALSPSSLYYTEYYSQYYTYYEGKIIYKKDFDKRTLDAGVKSSLAGVIHQNNSQVTLEFSYQRSLLAQQEFFDGLPMNFSFGIGYGKVF
jgi:hypothetical protein